MKTDTEVSLFLSGASSNFIYEFYCGIEKAINLFYDKKVITLEKFYDVLDNLGASKFENYLKRDLGIYDVEFDPKKGRLISDYKQIDKLYKG